MGHVEGFASELQNLVGQQIVVDTKGAFLYIGTLGKVHANSLLMHDVDVHNALASNTSNDLYLIEAVKYGIRANRKSAYVLAKDIVSVSPLADILVF